MPLVLTRKTKGRADEPPTRLGQYSRLSDAAFALAGTLNSYPEYGSDPLLECWWAKDKLGRTYEFEVTRELPSSRQRDREVPVTKHNRGPSSPSKADDD